MNKYSIQIFKTNKHFNGHLHILSEHRNVTTQETALPKVSQRQIQLNT